MSGKKTIEKQNLLRFREFAMFRAMTVETLQRRCFPRLRLSGVQSWIQRRLQNNQLTSDIAFEQTCLYRLTPRSVKALEDSDFPVARWCSRPLGPEAKRNVLAFLIYCNPEKGHLKDPYRPAFDKERFPELHARFCKTNSDPFRRKLFYRDQETIGYFVVDRGQAKFVANKVRPKLYDLLTPSKYPEMRGLVEAGRFRLTLATASESRAEELRSELEHPTPPFPVEVVVIPELVFFTLGTDTASPTLF